MTFRALFQNRYYFAFLLTQVLLKNDYVMHPVVKSHIFTKGKRRTVYQLVTSDKITQRILLDVYDWRKHISPDVYSYLPNIGRLTAINSLRCYVREYRNRTHIKERGLYIWHTDILSYGESISLAEDSGVWKIIGKLQVADYWQDIWPDTTKRLLKESIQPQVYCTETDCYTNVVGPIDGSPITPMILNLYLYSLDEFLGKIEGGHYIRYGDDVLFVHSDSTVFEKSIEHALAIIKSLGLAVNSSKTQCIYWNGAARKSPVSSHDYTPSTCITYLGLDILFNGSIALPTIKLRELIRDVEHRLANYSRVLAGHIDNNQRGAKLAHLVNRLINTKELTCHPHVHILLGEIDSRSQLKHIDYILARLVLRYATSSHSVKKFRQFPLRHIRQVWGLESLEYMRNNSG